MKYIYKIFLIIILIIPPLSAQEKPPAEENSLFSIFDIFSYEHPVEKSDEEKKWSLNLGAGYMEKKGIRTPWT